MKKAFTLIELLVVIAIIAILASILFPVFAQAKTAAKGSVDLSNVRQVGTAFQLYLADHDDTYPPLVYFGPQNQTVPNNFGQYRWPWLIHPYAKSFQVFWSPLDDKAKSYQNMSDPMGGYYFSLMPSWGYNQKTFSPDAPTGYAPIGNGALERPDNTILLASSIYWTNPTDPRAGYFRIYPPEEWAGTATLSGLSYGHVWPRGNGDKVSILWADTHVGRKTIQQVGTEKIWKAFEDVE